MKYGRVKHTVPQWTLGRGAEIVEVEKKRKYDLLDFFDGVSHILSRAVVPHTRTIDNQS